MTNSGQKIDARRKKILEFLSRDGQVRVADLSEVLSATMVTIRSDLDALARDGYLERTQGGAIQTVKNYYNLDFLRHRQENIDQKKAIACAVSGLVRDGDTLMINSGTTTYFTAVELKKHKNLNIVTNSIAVAVELSAHPTFRVILLGGDINAQYSFTYGDDAQEQLKRYKADYAILSIDGVSIETGITTYHAEEATIDRIMMDRARETLVVADSSKFNHESFSFVADIDKIQHWLTDRPSDPEVLAQINQIGDKVVFSS